MESRTGWDIARFDYFKAQRDCDKVLTAYIDKYKDDFEKGDHNLEEETPDYAEDYLSPFG